MIGGPTKAILMSVPVAFHKRLRAVATKIGMSMTEVARQALYERVEELEKKLDETHERRRLSKYEQRRAPSMMRSLGESSLAPQTASAPGDEENDRASREEIADRDSSYAIPATTDPEDKATQALYDKHAQRILESLSDPTEKRVRIAEAVKEVRDAALVVEPDELEIRKRLQSLVLKLRSAQPAGATPEPAPAPEPDADVYVLPIAEPSASRFASPYTGKTLAVNKFTRPVKETP